MSGQTKRRENSRKRLLQAAARLFRKQGYEETSIDQVAAKAGLVKGTFYYNFSGKEELVLAVAAEPSEQIDAEARDLQARKRPASEILAHVLDRVAGWVERNPKIARAAYPIAIRRGLEASRPEDRSGHRTPSFRRLLADIVAYGQQRGELRRDVPPLTLGVHLSMSYVTEVLFWLADRRGASMRKRARLSLELFLHGAGAASEQRP